MDKECRGWGKKTTRKEKKRNKKKEKKSERAREREEVEEKRGEKKEKRNEGKKVQSGSIEWSEWLYCAAKNSRPSRY